MQYNQQGYRFHQQATIGHSIIPRIPDNQTILDIDESNGCFAVCRTWRQRMALADGFQLYVGSEAFQWGTWANVGYGAFHQKT